MGAETSLVQVLYQFNGRAFNWKSYEAIGNDLQSNPKSYLLSNRKKVNSNRIRLLCRAIGKGTEQSETIADAVGTTGQANVGDYPVRKCVLESVCTITTAGHTRRQF